jgi:LPS-assembly lipoprotein
MSMGFNLIDRQAIRVSGWVAALCLVLLVAACGFQLRGDADLPFESVYVQSAGSSQFATELRRVFEGSDSVVLTDAPEHAEVIVNVVAEQQEQKILSISASGSVNEYELLYWVRYRIMDKEMEELVAPGEIRVRRDLTYTDTETLAKESETRLLFRDMRTDAVQQMLRRLSAITSTT